MITDDFCDTATLGESAEISHIKNAALSVLIVNYDYPEKKK